MRVRSMAALVAAVIVASCTTGGGQSPGTTPGPASPGTSPGASPGAVTGTAVISGWRASPEEGEALTQALLGYAGTNPGIAVDYQPIAGDYRTVMITKFASAEIPDVFYVNAEYAPEWIGEGFLHPLDDYIARDSIDLSQFYEGYLSTFQRDGMTYGLPKDGNTIALAYNSDHVSDVPATMDDLVSTAEGLKGQGGLTAPMCLNPGLDRGLAFLYAQGGSVVSDDGSAATIDSPESTAAVQWYLDLFKNGLGMTAADLGSGWCGEALGKGQVAMTFEGGWLDPYMASTFPDINYTWAEMPEGSGGRVTISYTVSYSIGADSANKDQGWELLKYLTGPDGMARWTAGGVALPSRKDVPTPEGKEVLATGSEYARPGSGFMPGYVDVQKAFQDAMTAEIQAKSYSADPVVSATKSKIDEVLGQ
jgi:multiple sugar transport system substrate-binding protein